MDLELRDVSRSFGEVRALDGISLAVEPREFCVVVGPSGCGKSTLLRCIAGLEPVDAGEVLIGGEPVAHLTPRRRDVAFVFQSYALYPHMTVRGNLEFPLKLRGVPRDERRRRTGEAARLLGIEDLLDRKPRALSGGQRQRVAMGRAVVRRPRLFLFDEPLSNLDARLRAATRVELVELHRRLGTTAVYVTHDQAEAMTLGERVVVMRAGRILQVGPPREVYERPADPFVASFFGSPPMNLIQGRLVAREGRLLFTWEGPPVEAPAWAGEGPATMGVRPEDLRPGDGPLTVAVRLVEDLGSERYAYGDVEGSGLVFRVPEDAPAPAAGEALPVAIRRGRTHWFRRGRRLEPPEGPSV